MLNRLAICAAAIAIFGDSSCVMAQPAPALPKSCEALTAEAAKLKADLAARIGARAPAMAQGQVAAEQVIGAGAIAAQGLGSLVPGLGAIATGIAQDAQALNAKTASARSQAMMADGLSISRRIQEIEAERAARCGEPRQ